MRFEEAPDILADHPGSTCWPAAAAVRIAPAVARSAWTEGPEDAELLIVSTRSEDLAEEIEIVPAFWPV